MQLSPVLSHAAVSGLDKSKLDLDDSKRVLDLGTDCDCPESSPTFVAIWYTLGIFLTGLIGRLIAPMALRW
jgi:hypothetical protein